MDAALLTGWVKLGEIWQLNLWIWILQAKEIILEFSILWKYEHSCVHFIRKGFYFFAFLLIPISQVHTTS